MDVVIVESPAKAKTINKYLGNNYNVLASYGHIRDLPAKDGSVKPDDGFLMDWEVDSKAKKRVSDIAKAVKEADRLILATDPDREGEAISWHVLSVLEQKKAIKGKPVQRVVFNAITKSAILEAMENPRDIDEPLVNAYLARRALDYLVGFTLSPVLWRKLPGARSAGRVQSVALRLVCEREREIEVFVPQEYWSVTTDLTTANGAPFQARVVGENGEKLQRLDIKTETHANALKATIDHAALKIESVEAKAQKRNPYPPFTTSTMQQEASRKLGFPAARTMQVAQRLYEGIDLGGETTGLITYMRTDGVQMAPEAIQEVRKTVTNEFGENYCPNSPRLYSTKAKNAQEAHEAIRPTDPARLPASVRSRLDDDQFKLYELIWKRTLASQMVAAEIERTTVEISANSGANTVNLRANGSVVRFDGFLKLYQEGRDDDSSDDDSMLPAMSVGADLTHNKTETKQHFTEPPARYSEATLIKKMEELGIGRPSTYTSTLSTLRDRNYVELEKRRLIPVGKGRIVTAFLESFFERYVQYDFTANLEEQLDQISAGELQWKDVLSDFWSTFSNHVHEIKDLRVSEVLDALNEILAEHLFPREGDADPRDCPSCDDGRLSLKLGRYGAFVGCSNYPECKFTRQLGESGEEAAAASDGPKVLGIDPDSSMEVTLRAGRFGPYIQLGEEAKPKRASIPKGWDPAEIDFEKAMSLLALPRDVGEHPESGKMISAGIGRYGPFVLHDGKYANLDSVDEVFTVGLNRAVDVLATKASKGSRRTAAAPLKELGEHPDGGPITVKDGRYGPYVNHGKVNATLPKDMDPQSVTLEKALELIEAKAGATKKKAPAKKAASKKSTTKKTTAKKKTATKKTDNSSGDE